MPMKGLIHKQFKYPWLYCSCSMQVPKVITCDQRNQQSLLSQGYCIFYTSRIDTIRVLYCPFTFQEGSIRNGLSILHQMSVNLAVSTVQLTDILMTFWYFHRNLRLFSPIIPDSQDQDTCNTFAMLAGSLVLLPYILSK